MFASNFEQEEKGFKNRKTIVSLFVTLSVHALILLVLFLVILHTPDPPYEDSAGGMAINFGFDEAASGDEQAFSQNPGPMENAAPATSASAPSENTPEEQLTEDDAETEVVAPKVEEKPKPKPKPNPETTFKPTPKPTKQTTTTKPATNNAPPAPPAEKAEAVFTKGAYGKPNNSAGDGTGGGKGDQGKPNGDPNSGSYLGGGNGTGGGVGDGNGPGSGSLGNGGSWSLAGRKIKDKPNPIACQGVGKVAVTIRVNRQGQVVEAIFKRFSSTTFDDCNVQNALAAARKTTWYANPNAAEIQEGTITYVYQVK